MARKTFICYKYSESQDIRDDIIDALGDDATFYQGETSDSPDMTDLATETIKSKLKDMLFSTSVTIVIVSPELKKSKWVDWEIEYSLKEITRSDRTSRTNGIVGVVAKFNGNYDWLISSKTNGDGCTSRTIDDSKLYNIIANNRFNLKEPVYTCDKCKTVSALDGSYISLINEEEFMANPTKYIENAYEKSNSIAKYNISKTK